MGNSASAILFYGYRWDEEEIWPWNIGKEGSERDDCDDWVERYLARIGKEAPESYEARRDLERRVGVVVDTWNHHEYALPYVAVAGSITVGHQAVGATVDSLDVDLSWRERLNGFCRTMGIEIPDGGPKWWLVPYYG